MRVPVEARIGNLGPVREYGERSQSNIDADYFGGYRQRLGFALNAETGKPSTRFALDRDRLNGAFQRAVQFYLDMSCALHPEFSGIQQTATIAIGWESDTVVPEGRSETRKPGFVSAFHAGEKGIKRLIDPAQNILATGEIGQRETPISAHRFQLVSLMVVVDRLAAEPPCSDAFFESGVIKRCGVLQFTVEKCDLSGGRQEAIFVRQSHLPAFLPFYVFTDYGFADGADRTSIVTTAPKSRKTRFEKWKFLAQFVGSEALQSVNHLGYADRGIAFHEDMNVIGHDFHEVNHQAQSSSFLLKKNLKTTIDRINKNRAPVLRAPHNMKLQTECRARVFGVSLAHTDGYTSDCSITQQEKHSANAEHLFRCQLKQAVPEA